MAGYSSSLGIDIGSVSVKLVLLEDGHLKRTVYRRFHGRPFETLYDILRQEFSDLDGQPINLGHTGIGGKTAQAILGGRFFGEIASLAAGNFHAVPNARTVVEMGGEDSKLLILDGRRRIVRDFAMNAQCAAGTGSFLDQQANRLKISIENEFGQLALKSQAPPRIAGRCSVFAKSDMIHLQQIGAPDYDIVAGLCYAVARNFKSSIARGKKFEHPVVFEGGVAANPGMVRAFSDILELGDGQPAVPENYNVIAALGAALLADQVNSARTLEIEKVAGYLKFRRVARSDREALSFDYPDSKYYGITLTPRPKDIDNLDVFLGVDVGSLSTNLVLIDREHRVIARRYLMTEGRPIEAVRRGLREIDEEVGDRVTVRAVGTTGSGRYLTGDILGADVIRNEITAQATAAVDLDPGVDTIFEIGGQDSKYISIDKRSVIDFEMNKACAAGTGSFLQEQAEKLDIDIETEFSDRALTATCPVGCGERCTVFMESDLVAHQRSGASKDDLLAGLAYSIAANYLTKVVGDRRVGDHIFFQGGVAWNRAVVAAFERLTGKSITVPPHHDVTGAIGAAILAEEKLAEPNFKTSFRGFDIYKRQYRLESFQCEDCPNQCEIHKVDMEGVEPLCYGARCEKYDVKKKARELLPPDYARTRQRFLSKKYSDSVPQGKVRGTVGIPRVLHYFEYYPFWKAFFESAGFAVTTSDQSSQSIVEEALELFSAETCFPIKIVYGHIANLLKKKIDYIFLPSLIKVAEGGNDTEGGAYICPYVQTIGSSIEARFGLRETGVKFITRAIYLSQNVGDLRHKLKGLAADFHLSDKQFGRSVDAGLRAYQTFRQALRDEGEKVLRELAPGEKVLVMVSRPYNGYDRRLSLDLPDKVRNLGVKAIPLDFLSLEKGENDTPFMYWRYGRKILAAARYIREHPNLYAVYITSFGCGPDSFITHFFRKAMSGKPYLQLELDEHSADAGLITRCEAFVDSLRFYSFKKPVSRFSIACDDYRPFEKTIYIPNMCDHAYALRGAFERCGLKAEVLDEPDSQTLEFGKKFTSGKECFPCVITTGDMVKKIKSPDFDRSKAVFFMPGANGPCRFGLYSQFHRMVLDDLGYTDIPIYSPNSEDGYADFGLDGTSFRTVAWKGLVFIDCLQKLLLSIRPYEVVRGETEKLYLRFLRSADRALVSDGPLEPLAERAAIEFSKIRTKGLKRPLVGVVGEIYLRNNRFSNNHLIESLEKLGLEVWLATFTEWPLYTSLTYRRDAISSLDLKGIIESSLQVLIQKRQEHKIFRAFTKRYSLRPDYPVDRVLKLATRYLQLEYKGEAILSIGKAIEMAYQGAAGIVNAMPFNCMPGTVVSSLSKKISEDHNSIPWLNISYEGLRDSGEETRLEAFAEQVRAFHAGETVCEDLTPIEKGSFEV